jgi:mono/diheme cytochrome c family protein
MVAGWRVIAIVVWIFASALAGRVEHCLGQENNAARQAFEKFQTHLRKAGDEYTKKAYDASSKELQSAIDLMKQMAPAAKSASQRSALKPFYEQLVKATNAVRKKGAKIDEMPSWSEFLKSTLANKSDGKASPPSGEISFTKDIAPLLAQRCGNCHIRRRSGEVSMATFEDLQKGAKGVPLITPGNASASRIMEVIEDGSMPKGQQKLTVQEVDKLREWLDKGAKFDGDKVSTPIMTMSASAGAENFVPPAKQTVSFAKDIAPVLVENCKGCHLEAQQIRGNFNMSTFAQLVAGAANGPVLQRGKGAESLIVQKLRGQAGGQRMPVNRPALDDAVIAKIETWINEGAVLDDGSPDMALPRIAEKAWIENASPDELKSKRLEVALNNWKRVNSNREAFTASNDDFVVLSDTSVATAERILNKATEVAAALKGPLMVKGETLFPDGATIFVFDKRYDYSEFGKMAESRSLPSNWTAHWRREGVNAYVAMTLGSSDEKSIERDLKINLASLWASSFEEMPRWFADGLGAYVYGMRAPRNDAVIVRWEQNGQRAAGALPNIKPLLQNTMNEEDASAIGFWIIRTLNQGDGKKRFVGFLKSLQNTGNFNKSFAESYGPLERGISELLGIKAN